MKLATDVLALDGALGKKTISKVMWRILPITFFLFVVSYLDRVNLGYAALQMNKELALSSEAFGFAAGIFFVGNLLFEVPSNIIAKRFGARIWLARIIFCWGIVAVLTAFVQTATQLYILRFLLGVAEAGFYPGVIFYFSYWFRERERAFAVAVFSSAVPVTYLFGAPISTQIMQHMTAFNISGWRWMLFLEALPALVGGLLCVLCLTDSPAKAKWLNKDEKAWLESELERDVVNNKGVRHLSNWQALTNPAILLMALIYFLTQAGGVGVSYWLPQIIRGLGKTLSLTEIGYISAFPYVFTAVISIVWAKFSDRYNERKKFAAVGLILAAVGLCLSAVSPDPIVIYVGIAISLTCGYAMHAPFFSMLTRVVSRPTVAVASAVIVSIGNTGGFFGTWCIGAAKRITGNDHGGFYILALCLVVGGILILVIKSKPSTSVVKN